MAGVPAKSGKVTAKMPKKQATTVQGLDGKYGVSGRVDDSGVLQLVLVAEYTSQARRRRMCTQSWNVSGVRQSASSGRRRRHEEVGARRVHDGPAALTLPDFGERRALRVDA